MLLFACAFWHSARRTPDKPKWLLKFAIFSLPLPWIACETGWFVAEYGRQPWAIGEILPTHLAVSSLSVSEVWFTLISIAVPSSFRPSPLMWLCEATRTVFVVDWTS